MNGQPSKHGVKVPLGISIIACNEAERLPRALASVAGWVEEIVVVINDCSDATAAVAESFGARVVGHAWEGYREQKNFATAQMRAQWVFNLDADEEISAELKRSIVDFLTSPEAKLYEGATCPRCVWFLGRWIRHGDWYPDTKLRLFRREAGRWVDGGGDVHEEAVVSGQVKKLDGDLFHYSFPTLKSHVLKMPLYAENHLRRELASGKKWSLTHTLFRPAWRFFRAYVLKRGFCDGFPGFYIAAATAFSTLLRYSRLYEHKRQNSLPPHLSR